MDVILLFDQYLLVKQQNDTDNTEYMTKWIHSVQWHDVAINGTMKTYSLLVKF